MRSPRELSNSPDRARRSNWNHWRGARRALAGGKQPTSNKVSDFKSKPGDGRTVGQLSIVPLIIVALAAPAVASAGPFDFGATLWVDLHLVGDGRTVVFLLDELRRVGPWPGSRTNLVDDTGHGTTLAEVYAHGGDKPALLFSQGHCSLFHEWRTTNEAKTTRKVFSETLRLPMPTAKVTLVIKVRDRKGKMRPLFRAVIDPASVTVSRERRRGGRKTSRVHGASAPATSLDIVVLGDGYEKWQLPKYRADVARFAEVLLEAAPFSRFKDRINVWAVDTPSRQSGVDEPRKGIFRDTALSVSFNTFGSARYMMTTDNKTMRDIAANVPYDAIYIMVNTSRYGGGGIYNLYSTFVSDNEYDEYVFVHEFGHSFVGLADEYYTSQVSYNDMYPRGVEPWEPNITAQTRRAKIKWRDMIKPETPVPSQPTDPKCQGKVGLFEGAGYSAKGLYRGFVDCKMFGKAHQDFCPVCMRAVEKMVQRYLR